MSNALAAIALAAFLISREADPQVIKLSVTGNFDNVLVAGNPVGTVSFKFIESEPDDFYQIEVSNVGTPILWSVHNKSTTGFNLEIKNALTGEPYDPDVQCVVTVSR